jgi:porin
MRRLAAAACMVASPAFADAAVSGGYVGELLAVVDGGRDTGSVYTGLAWLAFEAGSGEWRFGGNVLAPHGTSLSARYLGDLSVASNIDADSDPRLQELWVERGFGPWSLRAGMLALDAEFWGLDQGALFVNSAFGAPPGVSMNLPGSAIYPVAAAGLRLAVDAGDGGTWRLAAVDGDAGDPLDDNPHGLDVDFGQGTLAVLEYEQVRERGEDATPDRWRVAVYRHSADVVDADGGTRGASSGIIAGWERAFGEDLGGFARVNASRRATSFAPLAVEVGLNARFPDHAPGTFGLALGWLDIDRGLGTAAGIDDADREVVLEATWALPFGAFTLQPDVQYVHQPGGSNAIDDAWVVGLRVAWAFER